MENVVRQKLKHKLAEILKEVKFFKKQNIIKIEEKLKGA